MRSIDVARRARCSVQQVRKLEAAGVLPPAGRTDSGYRRWDDTHVSSLLAYQRLADAIGPVEARRLMRDAHGDEVAMLARLDAAHARLDQERREVALARQAAESISTEPVGDVDAADSMSVGTLAVALGVRPSTLRHWEAEHLLRPARSATGARVYRPTDVRDARLVHQLRQGGHRITALRDLLPTLTTGGGWEALLDERERDIRTRSRALLDATVALALALGCVPPDP